MRAKTMLGIIAAAGAWTLAEAASSEAVLTTGQLRVSRIEADTLDYLFTSYAEAGGKAPTLSFNHRGGKTFFAKVGDSVGEYKVTAFEPGTAEAFDPTMNTTRKVKSGRVTLQKGGGDPLVLEMGKPCRMPGWRAQVVSLTSGNQWSVRAGDRLSEGDTILVLEAISERAVTAIAAGDRTVVIPLATDEDKVAANLVWKQQREEKERLVLAQGQAQAQQARAGVIQAGAGAGAAGVMAGGGALAAGRVTGVAGSEPTMFIGTEYRYPSEYEVWLIPKGGTNGGFQAVYIPRKFETRKVGTAIGPGPTFSHTTVEPGSSTYTRRGDSPMAPYPSPPRFSRFEYRTNP